MIIIELSIYIAEFPTTRKLCRDPVMPCKLKLKAYCSINTIYTGIETFFQASARSTPVHLSSATRERLWARSTGQTTTTASSIKMIFQAEVSSKKTNKQIQFYYYETCFCLFLEEIEDTKKIFRNYLTFSKNTGKLIKAQSRIQKSCVPLNSLSSWR